MFHTFHRHFIGFLGTHLCYICIGCVVRTSEEPGTKVEVGTVITVYIAADPSVQITVTPEEPAATEPTTTEPAPPETTDPTPTEPEYNTD